MERFHRRGSAGCQPRRVPETRDFRPVDRGPLGWAQVQARFLEAVRRIQPQVAIPPPMPDQLWGTGEFGDVEAVSTVARQPGGCGPPCECCISRVRQM